MEKISITHYVKLGLVVIFLIIFSATVTNAATYYVRTDGNDNNTGTTNSSGGAWRTISKAAGTVTAGDIVRVQAGTYTENVTESTSGSSGNEITYVANRSAIIKGTFTITGDYIRIIGFTFDGEEIRSNGIYLQNADFCEIWNNSLKNYNLDGIRTDSGGGNYKSDNCLFIGNYFLSCAGANDGASGKDFQVRGSHNLIAYNESDQPEVDFLYLFGQHNRVLNNYSHDVDAGAGTHTDFLQTGSDSSLGMGNTLVEANYYADTSGSDHHVMNLENGNDSLDDYIVFRRNVWKSIGGTVGNQGFGVACYEDYLKQYHETIMYEVQTGYQYYHKGSGSFAAHSVRNCIWQDAWTGSSIDVYGNRTPADHDYNIFYDSGGSVTFQSDVNSESNSQINVNPGLTGDLITSTESNAYGAGSYLTLVNDSPGTGTTFTVDDASFFRGDDTDISQYRGNLVVGDIITVGTDVLRIASISGNDITVTESFTWADNDPVYFGSDATPDCGALPYRAGGYMLSGTYTLNSGTVTVTPNDADLVRMVVVFEDGIPVGVDSIAPFTVSGVGSGSLIVRIYPLYAGKTLYVSARETDASGDEPLLPLPPQNLMIIKD